jgi:D-alanyl-D-alanine carboxypeptidase
MKPVRVKTVQVKAGPIKLASAGPTQPAPPITNAIPARSEVAETSAAVIAKSDRADVLKPEPLRSEMPPQPANHGTGQGILGVLPAASVPPASSQAMAYVEPARAQPAPQPSAVQQASTPKAVVHTGWIVQVGALESESEARSRLDSARDRARGILGKADSFTEAVAKGDKKLYRARFAGLDRDQAEAACRTLRRSDISCITIKN